MRGRNPLAIVQKIGLRHINRMGIVGDLTHWIQVEGTRYYYAPT